MKFFPILSMAVIFMLIPKPAFAWGPAAHLDMGLSIISDLALLSPVMAALLKRYADDFLYGSLAADITIGKNLSPYQLHCHNWQVAFSVLDLAYDESTQAFAWGYLSHLAADVVAHNYFVPYKTVEHYSIKGAGHTYWEIRYDAHVPRQVWEEGRRLSTRAFAEHDRHLRKILTGPLFPFAMNKRIFNSVIQFSRMKRWRKISEAHSRRTRRVLTDQQWKEARDMSIERIVDILNHGHAAKCIQADPTGHRNLLIARDLRNRLRSFKRRGLLNDPENVGAMFRPLFSAAIESKLDLPPLSELLDPTKPEKTRQRIRGLLSRRIGSKSQAKKEISRRRRRARIQKGMKLIISRKSKKH